jgi:hypothetical protein
MAREGSQFGGEKDAWAADQKTNLRTLDDFVTSGGGGGGSSSTTDTDTGNGSGTVTLIPLPSGHDAGIYRIDLAGRVLTAAAAGTTTPNVAYDDLGGASIAATPVGLPQSIALTGMLAIPSFTIESDGTADVVVTFTMSGVSGTGSLRFTAAATFLG